MKEINYLQQELYDLVKTDDLIFEFLQSGALDGIWYWDLENIENEWMSDKFWTLLGYDPSEKKPLASEWKDIIDQDDLNLATINLQKHLENPSYPYDQIVRYTHKNGSIVWLRCRGVAIYGLDGKAKRLLGAHNDLSIVINKQKDMLHKQIAMEELTKEILRLEHESAELKQINKDLEEKITNLTLYDNITNFMKYSTFSQQAKQLIDLAKRLNTVVNLIRINVVNYEYIQINYSDNELLSKYMIINEILNKEFSGSLTTIFDTHFILIFNIGYSEEEIEKKNEKIKLLIDSYEWSIVSPKIDVRILNKSPIQSNFEELIEEMSQYLS
jgi:hypothetical protein